MKKIINDMLNQVTEHGHVQNVKLIEKTFGSLFFKDSREESILHMLTQTCYDEEKSFYAIRSLLEIGLNPNVVDEYGRNFIQTALIHNCSEEFIIGITKEAIKHKLNVNHGDYEYQTIAHIALSSDYNGEILELFGILISNGFDVNHADSENDTIYDILKFQKRDLEYIKIKAYEETVKQNKSNIYLVEKKKESSYIPENVVSNKHLLTTEQIKAFEKYGSLLNYKNYIYEPAVAREKELKNLIISLAQDSINPIVVGESGVGKSALVHELVFKIKRGEVPNFLKNRIVFEINPGQVVAGCSHVGEFEENMNECMNLCKKHNVIAFIDEIHSIYGVGSSKNKDNDMSQMLKYYIDREDFKVIGATTTKEYEEYFNTDALKRRFEKIVIKEPEENILYEIISKVLDNYSKKKNIEFENEESKNRIINMLFEVTNKKHRTFDDRVNNPALVLSIIDKAFAIPVAFDEDIITIDHFIQSIQFNNRIYESAKEEATKYLNSKPKEKTKVIEFIPKNR